MNTINVNPDYLRALTHICAKSDIRYYLNGVLLEIRPRETRYIATDGHRIAIIRDVVPDNEPDQGGAAIIVPRDTCKAAKRAMKNCPYVTMQYDAADQLAECHIDAAAVLTFKPIDGKFPDFTRVIPAQVDGKPGAFNWQYLADFNAMAATAFNAKMPVELYPNGKDACALVLSGANPFVGAIMPVRMNNPAQSPGLPAWWTGKPDLKAAA